MREGVLNVMPPITALSAPATVPAAVDVVTFGVFRFLMFDAAFRPTRGDPDRATVEDVLERLSMVSGQRYYRSTYWLSRILCGSLLQVFCDRGKLFEGGFEVGGDLGGDNVRCGKIGRFLECRSHSIEQRVRPF